MSPGRWSRERLAGIQSMHLQLCRHQIWHILVFLSNSVNFFISSVILFTPHFVFARKNPWWQMFTVAAAVDSEENNNTYFNISVEQQLLCTQYNIFVLEFVSWQQFGGAVTELQIVAFCKLLLVWCKTQRNLLKGEYFSFIVISKISSLMWLLGCFDSVLSFICISLQTVKSLGLGLMVG